jgi:hypothetical protein
VAYKIEHLVEALKFRGVVSGLKLSLVLGGGLLWLNAIIALSTTSLWSMHNHRLALDTFLFRVRPRAGTQLSFSLPSEVGVGTARVKKQQGPGDNSICRSPQRRANSSPAWGGTEKTPSKAVVFETFYRKQLVSRVGGGTLRRKMRHTCPSVETMQALERRRQGPGDTTLLAYFVKLKGRSPDDAPLSPPKLAGSMTDCSEQAVSKQ